MYISKGDQVGAVPVQRGNAPSQLQLVIVTGQHGQCWLEVCEFLENKKTPSGFVEEMIYK